MKFAVAVGAVLSMLVIRGDGRPVPASTMVPWQPSDQFPALPQPRSFLLWASLWSDGWGQTRIQLTNPGSERLQVVYRDVLRRAAPWKFTFRAPALYETDPMASFFIPHAPMLLYARYFVGPNRILVNSDATAMMTDDELHVLMSHELGHAIDAQTERVGHWSFRDVYWMNEQQFADHIARLLTTDAQVKAFNEKYIYTDLVKR